nr:helix-turn-helix domain-containing protein [Serratia quinivorans]
MQLLALRVALLSQRRAYHIIRDSLIYFEENMTTEYKYTHSVVKYLQENAPVSKSSILRILAELRKGGYIEIRGGYLLGMKRLPSDF